MQQIKVRQRVGTDGILHLEIPTEIHEGEVEVTVSYQRIQLPVEPERSLADFYGICADDPIVVDGGGVDDKLDDDMEEAFD
ncbi:hypothetical protein JOY44_28965 [Phormidium sp. CLA17]|uniref:hypothetical protein n=1 Tax=Leptolyngbya sp. Cla-17 TaxID=2803751 RepID=UPI001491E0E4|nr:hypothetical protein [Leptolyngbya sp. Cla-17]MBM0745457.1 hypothetical protein [Leptolyngbya sp. Cla-17]